MNVYPSRPPGEIRPATPQLAAQLCTALSILRMKQMEQVTGLRRSSIYYRTNKSSPYFDETFPKSVRLGSSPGRATAIGWIAGEVQAWLEKQAASRGTTAQSTPPVIPEGK